MGAQDKSEDMMSKCFICNIERGEFDRGAEGFENHIKRDHNMWAYGACVRWPSAAGCSFSCSNSSGSSSGLRPARSVLD